MQTRQTELFVCETLKKHRWKILFHDVRVWRTQVDVIARCPDGVLSLIEVKTQSAWGMAHLSPRQRLRLFKVAQLLGEFEPVQMRVAYVDGRRIELLPVDGLTD